MSLFQEISITWKGQDYSVAPDNIMRMMAQVEDIITLGELLKHNEKGGAPMFKLSMAFGVILRYAGAKASDDEVYGELISGGNNKSAEITTMLLSMMLPPKALQQVSSGDESEKPEATEVS